LETSLAVQSLVDLAGESPALRRLRERLTNGRVPLEIRPEIRESWLRSVAAGIRPESVVADFDPERDVDGRLCQAAAPIMRNVRDDLQDECVILMV
jgi:hypothetical protein